MGATRRHLVAALAFALLAIAWSFPLAASLSTDVPGRGPGDNLTFLWNLWWMRTALASGADPFHTAFLFAPVGVDLTLNTHTALQSFAGASVLGRLSILPALNVTTLAGLALNGFCAYLLAWRTTRNYGASLIGGLIFGGAPYFSGHLEGHFNLTMAWTIPLVAIAALELTKGSRTWAAAAGVFIGLTAYIDYYYVVFGFALTFCIALVGAFDWSMALARPHTGSRWPIRLVATILVLDLALMIAIVVTGGFSAGIGGARASFRGLFNPLQIFWALVLILLVLRWRPKVRVAATGSSGRLAGNLLLTVSLFALVAAPIVWHGAALMLRGDYVTQKYFWRSSPSGIDLGTMVLGNPFHGVISAPRDWYGALGIDPIESTAWLGLAPMFLAGLALRQRRDRSSAVRTWVAIGAIFFIWALGPHLRAFGVNIGMILPEAVLRLVPIVSNARIPGRAMVVVYLALSVIAAIGASNLRAARIGRLPVMAVVALAIIVDFLPAPFPVTVVDRPRLYQTLRDRPEAGTVLELPLGLHDGFGRRGLSDDRVYSYQTIHQRPIAGGWIARLPPSISGFYANDSLLNGLLELSEPDGRDVTVPLPGAETAAERLRAHGIAFVVLSRTFATPRLIKYVEETLPLVPLERDNERTLYAVK